MEKQIEKLKGSLFIMLIFYVLLFAFNVLSLITGSVFHKLYGLTMIVLCVLTFNSIKMFDNNKIKNATIISVIVSFIIMMLEIVEGFTDLELRFIQNAAILVWGIIFFAIKSFIKSIVVLRLIKKYGENRD